MKITKNNPFLLIKKGRQKYNKETKSYKNWRYDGIGDDGFIVRFFCWHLIFPTIFYNVGFL